MESSAASGTKEDLSWSGDISTRRIVTLSEIVESDAAQVEDVKSQETRDSENS